MEAKTTVGSFRFDCLQDPLGDRMVKDVPVPPQRPLDIVQVFPQYLAYGD
jgi:hypothetical protein